MNKNSLDTHDIYLAHIFTLPVHLTGQDPPTTPSKIETPLPHPVIEVGKSPKTKSDRTIDKKGKLKKE